jgi:DICT domain-containing protein
MKNSNSLLPELLQLFPELRAQIYFKTTLTAISHAMEDLVLASTEQPLVIANFQQERYYRQESARYQRIAQRTDRVYVLAAPETDFASAPASFATVGLEQTDELAQEWHLGHWPVKERGIKSLAESRVHEWKQGEENNP